MLTRWNDFGNTLAVMDEFRRRMNRVFGDVDERYFSPADFFLADDGTGTWPRVRVQDSGELITLRAEVPGLGEGDVKVTVNQDVLTLSGEKKSDAPEGYAVHRQERVPVKFSRSFSLGCKVDFEKANAVVKYGVLTITLPKAPESQPRQIAVKAS